MEKRNVAVDICKGLGILLVVIGHLGTIFGSAIYLFHMTLFFILSGYCFKDSYVDHKLTFIKKRFISLMVPYIVIVGGAWLITNHSTWTVVEEYIDKYHLIGTMWFLKCLFVSSVIGVFTIWGLQKIGIFNRLAPALFMLALTYAVAFVVNDHWANFFYITFQFLIGYAIKGKLEAIASAKTSPLKLVLEWGGVLLLLLTPSAVPNVIADCSPSTYITYCITSFWGSWLTLIVAKIIESHNVGKEFFCALGRKTLPIMIFHFTAFMIIDLLLENNIFIVKYPNNVTIIKMCAGIAIPILIDIIYIKIKFASKACIYKYILKKQM